MEQVNPSVYASADAEQKKERKKIIIISVTTILLILILLVAVIIAATNRNQSTTSGEMINIDETSENIDADTEAKTPVAESPKPAEATPAEIPSETTDTTTSIAKTGPEDFIPLALLGGSFTTFLTSLYLSKKSA